MADIKWLPAGYLDETVPELRATPSDWIVSLPGDVYAVASAWDDDDEPGKILKPGDVISFCWHEDFDDVEIQIAADGTFSVTAGAIEPRANCLYPDGDWEAISQTMADLVGIAIENGYVIDSPIPVTQYFWSDGDDFRFELTAEGPRFVKVAP